MTRAERYRLRADAKRALAAQLTAAASAMADRNPGSFVTGASGRSRAQNRGTNRALDATINAAVKANKLRADADDLDRRAWNIEHAAEIAADNEQRRLANAAIRQAERLSRRSLSLEKRLFIGVFPTCLSYSDRGREEDGDFKRVASLSFSTLELSIFDEKSPLLPLALADIERVRAMRGQEYPVSGCGQTVTLGWKLEKTK